MIKSIRIPRSGDFSLSIPTTFYPYIAVIITIISWGSAFAAIRIALTAYSPQHISLLRYGTASLILLVYVIVSKMPRPAAGDMLRMAGLGIIGIASYSLLLSAGQVKLPAATASFIIASAPMWMSLLAYFFYGERMRVWGWTGIAISFAGVAVIAIGKNGLKFDIRAIFVLMAALSQSLYSLGQKPLLKKYSAIQMTTYAIWGATLFMLPLGGGLIGKIQIAPLEPTLAVIYMAAVPGVMGYMLWGYALARLPAGRAGSFLYLVPPTAMFVAWLWLGELPALISLLGGVLVLAGVILVNTKGKS